MILPAALFIAVLVVSSIGYKAIEGWPWFDTFYMTVLTITTVGDTTHPLSMAGRWWTLGVIAFGVGVTTYIFFTLAGYLLEGRLFAAVGERRLRGRVRALTDHYILCGYGRVGREIAQDLVTAKRDIVIVDVNQESLDDAIEHGHPVVRGNAAEIDTLREAGIDRARGLVIATDGDAQNVYVTLSARVLRPDVFIIARANAEDSEARLQLAGANRIISPYHIGGKRMAQLAMRPTAMEFLDTVLDPEQADLALEDYAIRDGSRWVGRTFKDLFTVSEVIILALKRNDKMHFRPPHNTVLQAGDELVVAGPGPSIATLQKELGLSS
ncbi:MAG: potassium channel family protein [Vulcanimicrobiaceae bacterium]